MIPIRWGEDMELVLRLLDGWYQNTGNQIVYDPTAVCYTTVPHSLKRLLHQRDRWQRGLMDCLIKHRNMIANPLYGMLGLATMSYQFVFELLGSICSILYMLWPWFRNMFPKSWLLGSLLSRSGNYEYMHDVLPRSNNPGWWCYAP